MPNRNSLNYRYAFQGQEKDGETEMEAFQLRLWDGRIGRWLSPDPYGQHSSPYLGMGNNPIGTIDPDGGWEWEWWAKMVASYRGGTAFQSSQGDWGVQTSGKSSDGMYITTDFGGKRYDTFRDEKIESFRDFYEQDARMNPMFGPKMYQMYDTRHEAFASFFQIINPEAPSMNAFRALFPSKKGFDSLKFSEKIFELNKLNGGTGELFNGTPSAVVNSSMYYETAAEQGAAIFRSIAHGHTFNNGNKRTAVAVFQAFAKIHKLKAVNTQQMLDIASKVAQSEVTNISQIAKMITK